MGALAKIPTTKAKTGPVYFVVEKLVRPDTGEVVGALVPKYKVDIRTLRERGYKVGTELRAELKKPRNPMFHRFVHALGGFCVDQIEGFEGLDQHAAIKRLQRESGVFCEETEAELPGIGKLLIKVPMSIAFDSMEEGQFQQFFRGICEWIVKTYWPDMTPEGVEQMALMVPEA